MNKQKNILSFFKPISSIKRSSSEVCTNGNEPKKSKDCGEKENDCSYSENAKSKLQILCKNLTVLDPNIGSSWFYALEREFSLPYFKKLSSFVEQERAKFTVYPSLSNVWSWTKLCTLPEVKVVILGQDPYHNPNQAHGLCFSVPRGIPPPPSLLNIYKELEKDIDGFVIPSHGDLTGWAKQGVLLLNACLTVRQNTPNSHVEQGWEKITNAVIKAISNKNQGVVFLLWGAFAQKKAACVDQKKHHLLKSVHPSPLSAHRGFFGCKHFSQCNKLLKDEGRDPINWGCL